MARRADSSRQYKLIQDPRKRPVKTGPSPQPPDSLEDRSELVDVVDSSDTQIGVMPLAEVHRQQLYHRSVLVLLYDRQGKLYLQRRSLAKDTYPGRWDLSATGHVRAGESRYDAALRELSEELGITVDQLDLVATVPASAQTAYEFVSLYSAGRVMEAPKPNPRELAGGFFYDHDELACLAASFREQLTPGLIHFWEQRLLFP